MNIVAIQNKIDFYLDAERSPRFKPSQKDKAINTAITDIILSRYDNIKRGPKDKEVAFQSSQRLRDELYTLVKPMENLVPTNISEPDLIPSSVLPSDYMFLIMLEANISGRLITTIPLTYDEWSVIKLNPYYRPSITWPERIYRIEAYNGVKIVFGDVGRLVSAKGFYISKPATVKIGTEINDNLTQIYDGSSVIAYLPSSLLLVTSTGNITLNLAEEEEYAVGTNGELYATLVSGVLYYNYVNTDLPEALHEEVCRTAAKVLSGNVENFNREQSLEKDLNK